jgi:hypothetical protein
VAGPLALNRWDHTLALDQDLSTSKLPGPRMLLAEEPTGRPLFAVEERAFGTCTIARLGSLRQGEREQRGKSARREVQVFTTVGIVRIEYATVFRSLSLLSGSAPATGCSRKSASRPPV